jgi:hypothetical protein
VKSAAEVRELTFSRDSIELMDIRKPAAVILGFAAPFLFSFASSLALAGSHGSNSAIAAQEREATAQKFVQRSLHTWQRTMNLTDWNVKVELLHASALEPKTLGNIHWDLNTKSATIGVLSSYDYTLPTPEMLGDMEVTIVHELVHLDLASLPRNADSMRNEEFAVNQLTHALLDLAKRPQNSSSE